ncbi:MAG: dUTP diphosphatase [Clostridiales bacterium]|nr:dUTP diphosphatase [Clostridiales bacterium]
MNTEIFVEKISEDAILPAYAHDGDAGMDLYSVSDVVIAPGETVLVHTGLKFAIPQGFEVQIRPRSGISLNTPLRIPNAPGTIDSGYRGEICIIMENTSSDKYAQEPELLLSDKGNKKGPYHIRKGDRVAQMVVARYEQATFRITESVDAIGVDRAGGFGSTGVS